MSAPVVHLGLQLGELIAQQIEPRVAVLRRRAQRFVLARGRRGSAHTARRPRPACRHPRRAHRAARAAHCASPGADTPAGHEFRSSRSARSRKDCKRYQLAIHVGAGELLSAPRTRRTMISPSCSIHCSSSQRTASSESPREPSRHFGALGALAHDVAAAASSGNEHERIDHDRLAGAGLPGERGRGRPRTPTPPRPRLQNDRATFKCVKHGSTRHLFPAQVPPRVPSAASSAAAGCNRSPADAAA